MLFLEYLKNNLNLAAEDLNYINTQFKEETVKKGKHLVQPHSCNKKFFFIESGLIRTYYIKNGKDITEFFFLENQFTGSMDSIFNQATELAGWEASADSVVRSIHYADLERLYDKYPQVQKLILKAAIEILLLYAKKLASIQFQTADQRYIEMLDTYPKILLKVPLGHIASYLGITQQTLSVIRSKK